MECVDGFLSTCKLISVKISLSNLIVIFSPSRPISSEDISYGQWPFRKSISVFYIGI